MSALFHIIGNDPFLQFILWCVFALAVSAFLSWQADRIVRRIINVLHDQEEAKARHPGNYDELQARIAENRAKHGQNNRRKEDEPCK